jgi:glycerophosphoryl diester phosphodiesterase
MRSSPSGRPDAGWLTAQPYAHRGLHGPGAPENSRAAFAAAIARGHGIELDVQASLSGSAFVFHDEGLDRLTGESGPLAARGAEELERIRLTGSDETIPTLDDVLDLVGGRMPVLIEVKARGRASRRLCSSVATSLCRYGGPAAVMSFDPRVGGWFARHFPQFVRGLVVTEQGKGRARGRLERAYSLWRARPDFLAYDIRDLPSPFSVRQRARGLPVLTWTCRGAADRAKAALHADQIIYETA